jgi:hypothetical protein
VINWLVTWPAEEVNGYMVSSRTGLHLPMPRFVEDNELQTERMKLGVYPPELWETVVGCRRGGETIRDDEVADFLGTEDATLSRGPGSTDILDRLGNIYAGDVTARNIAVRLMREFPTDVTAVYFRGSDTISHIFWRYLEPETWSGVIDSVDVRTLGPVIDRYYAKIDSVVGSVLENRGPQTVVVFTSDHGFAGHRGYPGYDGGVALGIDMHREEGVFIIEGPGIIPGANLEGVSPLDLTPTILAMSGLPVADDMDGRVLTEAIDPDFLDRHPLTSIETYESDTPASEAGETIPSVVDEEIAEQLRAVGYIN